MLETGIELLKALSGLGTKKYNDKNIVVPVDQVIDSSGRIIGTKKIKMTPYQQQLFDRFLKDNTLSLKPSSKYENRAERYRMCKSVFENSPIVSKGVNLYKDEVTNSDVQSKALKINASSKVTNYISNFFEKVSIDDQFISVATEDLTVYGDHYSENEIKDNNITHVNQLTPFDVLYRIEYEARDFHKLLKAHNNNLNNIEALYQAIKTNSTNRSRFRKQLFGYLLEGKIAAPPWEINHMRLLTTAREFYPYGRPLILPILSTYFELRNAMELHQTARAANFPIEIYRVKVDQNMTPEGYHEAVNNVAQQYLNQSLNNRGKEENSMGRNIFLPDGLIEFELKNPNLDLKSVEDIRMLQELLATGMDIPPDILLIGDNKTGWGSTGQGITKQYKPLARKVYYLQTVILSVITQIVRTQFALSGDFDYREEFELQLSFPNIEDSSDLVSLKSSLFSYANEILQGMADMTGIDLADMPLETVQDVLIKHTDLRAQDVEDYINSIEQVKDEQGMETTEVQEKLEKQKDKIIRKINNLSESQKHEILLNAKKTRSELKEGVSSGKHYYSSLNLNTENEMYLNILNNNRKGLRG